MVCILGRYSGLGCGFKSSCVGKMLSPYFHVFNELYFHKYKHNKNVASPWKHVRLTVFTAKIRYDKKNIFKCALISDFCKSIEQALTKYYLY